MNVVQSGLKVLEESCQSRTCREEMLDIISDIRKSNTIAIDTANEILTYDKVETKKMKLDLSVFSIKNFITEIMGPFQLQVSFFDHNFPIIFS